MQRTVREHLTVATVYGTAAVGGYVGWFETHNSWSLWFAGTLTGFALHAGWNALGHR